MTNELYQKLDQNIFSIEIQPEKSIEITNIEEYNKTEGLALSDEEVKYLEDLSRKINRKLTDSEVLDFHKLTLNTVAIKYSMEHLSLMILKKKILYFK